MSTQGSIPILLLILSAATAVAADRPLDAATRDFDQIHLDLRVTPDLVKRTVRGTALLRFASLVPRLETLRLHCEDTEVLSVRSGEAALSFELEGGILSIRLAEPVIKGHEATVAIEYLSSPKLGFFFHVPTKENPGFPRSFYTQGQGTWNRRWIPCYDLSDDRLTVEVRVTVPDELKTVGNGLKVDERYLPGPLREDHWVLDHRIPTYLISLAAGPYEVWLEKHGNTIVEYHAFQGRLPEARTAFGRTPEMLDFFGEYLACPYPYERYSTTVVWDFVYGGMENATATTMNMRLLHTPDTEPNFSAAGIAAHELAHQWFGDLITTRTWHHIWLNEGFATYFADLFFESADGVDEFRERRRRQNRGYMDGTPDPEKLGLTADPRGDLPLELFGGKQYSRGAAILHMLRLELGDLTFRDGVRLYVKKCRDSAVVTEDFRRCMETVAGRDLAWFFDQWVYGAGYPELDLSWRRDAGRGVVVVKVRQTQPEGGGQGVFRFTLPVRIETGERPVTARLEVRRREHEFEIPCPGEVEHVRFDDGCWLLARLKVAQPAAAWIHQLASDSDVGGRLDAVEALEGFGERGAEAIAGALQNDGFWAVRVEAARALGRMPDSEWAWLGLRSGVKDADPRVREAAYAALGGRTAEEAGDLVRAALAGGEKHPYVLAAAARSAGRLHLPEAFELLRDLLSVESHREIVRQGAIEGFAALGDRRAAPLAVPYLQYRYGRGAMSMMRKAAISMIAKLEPDSPRTHLLIVELLSDPYFRMRAWAADMCATYGVASAIPALRNLEATDPHGDGRRAARRALKKLTSK